MLVKRQRNDTRTPYLRWFLIRGDTKLLAVAIQEDIKTGKQGLNSLDQLAKNSSVQMEDLIVAVLVPERLSPIENALQTHRITKDALVHLQQNANQPPSQHHAHRNHLQARNSYCG
jgi:hypothetical protein